jgi:hypothetical protein
MGIVDTIKGWLNIGGIKLKIDGLNQVIPKDGKKITAKVSLSAGSDKTITKVISKLLLKRTAGHAADRETKEYTIAEAVVSGPFELKAGESRSLDLNLEYSLARRLKDLGGVLGGIGKLAALAMGEKDAYFVLVQADVKGTALSPSTSIRVTVQ